MRPLWDRLDLEEKRICDLICQGCKTEEIARMTHRTPAAIGSKVKRIFDRVGAESRLQLAVLLTEEKMRAEPVPVNLTTSPTLTM